MSSPAPPEAPPPEAPAAPAEAADKPAAELADKPVVEPAEQAAALPVERIAPAPRPRALAPERVGPARRLDRITTVLLAASVSVATGAATPALLRVAGVDVPAARALLPDLPGAAPHASSTPLILPHRPPEILAHEGPAVPDGLFDPDSDDEAPLPEARGQLGLTRGPLVLHEMPGGAAGVVGDVKAGEMVTILRIAGDWALVYYGGAGGLVVGWAKKSEIAIR